MRRENYQVMWIHPRNSNVALLFMTNHGLPSEVNLRLRGFRSLNDVSAYQIGATLVLPSEDPSDLAAECKELFTQELSRLRKVLDVLEEWREKLQGKESGTITLEAASVKVNSARNDFNRFANGV